MTKKLYEMIRMNHDGMKEVGISFSFDMRTTKLLKKGQRVELTDEQFSAYSEFFRLVELPKQAIIKEQENIEVKEELTEMTEQKIEEIEGNKSGDIKINRKTKQDLVNLSKWEINKIAEELKIETKNKNKEQLIELILEKE